MDSCCSLVWTASHQNKMADVNEIPASFASKPPFLIRFHSHGNSIISNMQILCKWYAAVCKRGILLTTNIRSNKGWTWTLNAEISTTTAITRPCYNRSQLFMLYSYYYGIPYGQPRKTLLWKMSRSWSARHLNLFSQWNFVIWWLPISNPYSSIFLVSGWAPGETLGW